MIGERSIPLTRPCTGEPERKALARVLESGWLTQGEFVTQFEESVRAWLGAQHAVACSNCTTALHVALLLNGVGSGDEVIVPSYTWIATPNVVRMVRATPIFADVDLETFNITPETVERTITPHTKAVLAVHQFGLPADMEGIREVARKRGVVVIEDAACALGSLYKGKPVGSLGNVTCFSFHPRKVITTGEGGMIVGDTAEVMARARVLINHGASISDSAKHDAATVRGLLAEEFREVGYNYRMTNLQGALGVAQMGRLDDILVRRRFRARRYGEALSDIPFIITPSIPDYATPNWQSYAVRIVGGGSISRDTVAQRLLDIGIACRPGYMACHLQPVYRAAYPGLSLTNTEQALDSVILLPLYPQMTDEEQDVVIEALRRAMVVAK